MPCSFHTNRHHLFETFESGCQFADLDWPLITIDEQEWCFFHCPMTDKQAHPTQKAEWSQDEQQAFFDEIHRRREAAIDAQLQTSKNTYRRTTYPITFLDLTGVVFPLSANFTGVDFPAVSFAHARFEKTAWFGGTTFEKIASFEETSFGEKAVFVDAKFENHTMFYRARFEDTAGFNMSRFRLSTEFSNAKFGKCAYFDNATFGGTARFSHTTFEKYAVFGKARFEDNVDFWAATFGVGATFVKATFEETANFNYAKFGENVYFQEATFGRNAMFWRTRFEGAVDFVRAKFTGDVDFSVSAQSGTGEEAQTNSFSFSNFSHAIFASRVTFENRQFLTAASFAGCLFTKAPIFHGCRLAQGTTFPPRLNFKDVTSAGAVQAYQTLKFAMEQVRGRREESMFHALEQHARRLQTDTPRSEKLIAGLYEVAADYGESFLRPLVWLLLVTELFVFLYASTMTGFFPQGKSGYDVASLNFAIEQVVRPLSGWGDSSATAMNAVFCHQGLPFSLKLLSTIQSLANVGFLGLFIFAVRRKFKLG